MTPENRRKIQEQIKGAMVAYIRTQIRHMFRKHGIEYTEQKIKDVYSQNEKLRNSYLEQYRLILQGT